MKEIVGEDAQNILYHVRCEYCFKMSNDDFLEQDIIIAVMDILQPRIEELLGLITLESGYANLENINN